MSLRNILDISKLIGSNFLNWYHNIRLVLKQGRRLCVLENPIPHVFDMNVNDKVKTEY
jgi:hypothetical protein